MAVAYEELLANHNGYAFKLENIAGNDFETGSAKLEEHLNTVLAEIESSAGEGKTIQGFKIGNTFARRKENFDIADPDTWRTQKSVSALWTDQYSQKRWTGLVVLAGVNRATIPRSACRTHIHGHNVGEQYAGALVQRLLHRYVLTHDDKRVKNRRFTVRGVQDKPAHVGVVYVVYRLSGPKGERVHVPLPEPVESD